jgi:hypothetical protein
VAELGVLGAVSGDVIAFVALGLNQLTGSSVPQGVAAVLIGVALIRISLRLIKRSHDFLVGVWVLTPGLEDGDVADLTQPIRPVEAQRMQGLISAYPGVTGIRELLVNFIGSGRVWIVARVEIDDDLRGAQVESLVRGIESSMKHESESIFRVTSCRPAETIDPIARAWPPGRRMPGVAGFYPNEEMAREHEKDLSPVPRDLEVYAHVEGLVGEENELLEVAEEDRKDEHHQRLHAIREELDRAWETLRRRAERRAKPGS